MKRKMCLCILLVGVVGFFSASFAQFNPTQNSAEEQDYPDEYKKNYFDLVAELGNLLLDDEEDDTVTKISLEGFNEDPVLALRGKETLSAFTDNPTGLAIVQRSCSMDTLLRPLCHPTSGGGLGGPSRVGTLTIHTTKRTVTIVVTVVGFQHGEKGYWPHNLFYSWGLAKVLDDMVADATHGKKHLSRRLFSTLSGEDVIEMNKRIYWGAHDCEMENKSESGSPDRDPAR